MRMFEGVQWERAREAAEVLVEQVHYITEKSHSLRKAFVITCVHQTKVPHTHTYTVRGR